MIPCGIRSSKRLYYALRLSEINLICFIWHPRPWKCESGYTDEAVVMVMKDSKKVGILLNETDASDIMDRYAHAGGLVLASDLRERF